MVQNMSLHLILISVLNLDDSQFVPETPGSPSQIIGAPHNRPNGRIKHVTLKMSILKWKVKM